MTQQSTDIRVKLNLNNRIIIWRYENKQLLLLKEFIVNEFNLNADAFLLEYKDDESDQIVILNDDDLNDAFDIAQQEQRKSLKIFIIPKDTNEMNKTIKKDADSDIEILYVSGPSVSNTELHHFHATSSELQTPSNDVTNLTSMVFDEQRQIFPMNAVVNNNNAISHNNFSINLNNNQQEDNQINQRISFNIQNNENKDNQSEETNIYCIQSLQLNNEIPYLEETSPSINYSNDRNFVITDAIINDTIHDILLDTQVDTDHDIDSINQTINSILNESKQCEISMNAISIANIYHSDVEIHCNNTDINNKKRCTPSSELSSEFSSSEENKRQLIIRKRKRFICYTCDKTFTSKRKKDKHKCNKYTTSEKTCPYCFKIFKNKYALGGHYSASKCRSHYFNPKTVSDSDNEIKNIKRKKSKRKKSHRYKNQYKVKYKNKDGSNRALKDNECETNWSNARKSAWNCKETNKHYYRFNVEGEIEKTGKWNKHEHKLFLNRAKEFGVNTNWGIFSKVIAGRVGYSCSDYWRKLLKNKTVKDKNYYFNPSAGKNGKWLWKWGKKKKGGDEFNKMRKFSFSIYDDELRDYISHEKHPNFEELQRKYDTYLDKKYVESKSRSNVCTTNNQEPLKKRQRCH
eukprot:99013_1